MDGGGLYRLKKKEYVLIAAAVFAGSALISYLFYNSPFGMFSAILLFPFAAALVQKEKKKRGIRKMNAEFKEYMYAVSGALLAGYSIERAFVLGQREIRQLYGEKSLLSEAFEGMEKRLAMNEPIERIFSDFAKKSESEDIWNFSEVFGYAKRSGGNFVKIIQTTIDRICDRIDVSEEIGMVIAQKSLEQKIMCVIPIAILGFFRFSSPEFIEILYGNVFGVIVMTAALLLYGFSVFLSVKIADIEV